MQGTVTLAKVLWRFVGGGGRGGGCWKIDLKWEIETERKKKYRQTTITIPTGQHVRIHEQQTSALVEGTSTLFQCMVQYYETITAFFLIFPL